MKQNPSRCLAAVLVLFLLVHRLYAVEVPPGGTELVAPSLPAFYAKPAAGQASKAGHLLHVRIHADAQSKPWDAQLSQSLPTGVEAGDRILVIVRAKALSDTSSAVVKLQLSEPPYTAPCAVTEISFSKDWQDYPVLFVPAEPLPPGKAAVVLLLGSQTQELEFESLRVLRYPATAAVETFPRIPRSYAGREADAPWRTEALERIERLRKADFRVQLLNPAGEPLRDTKVTLTLQRHAFGFGSAIPAAMLSKTGTDAEQFRSTVDRLFSLVVFENDLKDFNWNASMSPERKAARNRELDQAFHWLSDRHIAARGHYLMQVAVPPNLAKVKDPQAIREHFVQATKDRLSFVGSRVIEWDVINHPIAWPGADMLTSRAGLNQLDRDILKLARSMSDLPLLVNEDQLFRPGPQSDDTFRYLQQLREEGLRIDGLGNQAHIHESFLPSPVDVLKVTDHFAQVAPRQVITEFDIVASDEQLAADYTRDLLIACFSHPAYSGFLWWGFWEGAHWRPEAASWNRDWSPRLRGEVMEEWIGQRWRTQVTLTTDAQGYAAFRGFMGWYEAATDAGKAAVQLTAEKPQQSVRLER